MNRDTCEHFVPADLPCDKCNEQPPLVGCIGHDCQQCRQRDKRRLTDEVIAELWHKNGGFHHHFARNIERWLKGGA